MNAMSNVLRFFAACLLLALGACGGGGGDADAGTSVPATGTVIGAAGGTVDGPNGAKVVIPPGALAADTTIAIEQSSAGSPALPGGFTAFGPMFAITPHGTRFAVPVTVTVPFDAAAVPAGSTPALYKTNAQQQWEQVADATVDGATVSAQVSSFSHFESGLERLAPHRVWTFRTKWPEPNVTGPDDEGELHEVLGFGAGSPVFDLSGDGKTTLEVFSNPGGADFWVSAEDRGEANLHQTQQFIKRASNATLRLIITSGLIEAVDFNLDPTAQECPRAVTIAEVTCPLLGADIQFDAQIRTPAGDLLHDKKGVPLLKTGAYVSMIGRTGVWDIDIGSWAEQGTPAWKESDFEQTKDVNNNAGQFHPRARLIHSIFIDVDLSSVDPLEVFELDITIRASALNRRGRESGIGAFLRDPTQTGGTTLSFSGLEPLNGAIAPPAGERAPAPCSSGPDPAAGVLQFSAPSVDLLEPLFAGPGSPVIFVTRTQGSSGAVSATLSTGGGSATPGVHYTPLSTSVHFADGDTAPRAVRLEILPNADNAPDTTLNLTLSDPGGCATLGAQSNAVVTILDDDRLPPPPLPSGLDTSFGTAGKASSTETDADPKTAFGGDRSAMALQPDGKIVMVGGTFTDFILARFNADGGLDTGFGVGGKVTTDMGGGNRLEEATGVAIQPDGKIVVVGYTAIPTAPPAPRLPPTFALARYNTDGSLDTSFGSGGKVSGNVNGNAYAVAIQGDGRIVVAGEVSFPSTSGLDFSDFVIARFNANGNLDTSFGADVTGQVVTDFGGTTNSARNLVLQPDGAIVVSGKPPGSQPGFDHTDMARFKPDGSLDAGFGSGGKLTLAGVLVGEGLALQGDGMFVLAGSATLGVFPASSTRFALLRLNADGRPDTSFGDGGTVNTAFSVDAAAAAVALQRDGKIVAVGTTVLSVNPNFVVARYNPDGSIDPGFGSDGLLSIDFFGFSDIGESVLVRPDGKIVVGGQAQHNFDGYGLARVLP